MKVTVYHDDKSIFHEHGQTLKDTLADKNGIFRAALNTKEPPVNRLKTLIFALILIASGAYAHALSRPDVEFKIFQFPRTMMPCIDGDTSDWDIVPESYTYGTDQIRDTEDGHGEMDPKDLDVKVTVGWVKGMSRLYFLYEAYDDFWDMRVSETGYSNDIFEIAVDGNLSGGSLIHNPQIEDAVETQATFSGVHAQNYHIFTPPINNEWCLLWGCQPWIKYFPYSNYAYDYNVKHGESGKLVLEFWITPWDYAPAEGPENAIASKLVEDTLIGLSWSILEFDGGKRDGHVNLAWNTKMVHDASYLCAFRLMPVEPELEPDIEARWSWKVIDPDTRKVAFIDESIGEITSWKWTFGDGSTSTEQFPIHSFPKPNGVYSGSPENSGLYKVTSLEVSGPKGSSKTSKYWDIQVK